MLQTLVFVLVLGIAGLLFCKIEDTTYVNGLYWMVTTTLLIGFGDITPHTALMKVLAFPLILICVVLLALIVTSIVHILSDRARRRKLEMRQRLKHKLSQRRRLHAIRKYSFNPWKKKEDVDDLKLRRSLTLQEELEQLRKDEKNRELRASMRSITIGFAVFLLFWFVGALIFHLVEVLRSSLSTLIDSHGGTAIPFIFVMCMHLVKVINARFFLTIGFGDFYPSTEAGRPIFIVYALLAVPTMTTISTSICHPSNVVQTVTTNCLAFTMHGPNRQRKQVYAGKHFQIHSLNSLVKMAKIRTIERVNSNSDPIDRFPLLDMTNRLMTNLEVMHHHLQSLLMDKLSPEARNVIAAERARQQKDERCDKNDYSNLMEPARECVNDLELLNEYRKRYADILGELLVAKDRLLELGRELQDESDSKHKAEIKSGNVSSTSSFASNDSSEAIDIEV